MPAPDSMLPEGTDSIINGAAITTTDDLLGGAPSSSTPTSGEGVSSGAEFSGAATDQSPKAKLADAASSFKGQATDKVFEFAEQGKEKATDALDGLARLVQEAAASVDDKVGQQYGAYARQGADAISGFADTLRGTDVDELFETARGVVRKSPAVAIGAAAAVGFLIARIAKAGLGAEGGSSTTAGAPDTAPPTPATPTISV